MRYFVYILKSLCSEKTYVGMTYDLERRLSEHNSGKSTYTSKYKPWEIVYTEEFDKVEFARDKEKYYKTSAGRKQLKNLLNELNVLVAQKDTRSDSQDLSKRGEEQQFPEQ